MKQELEIQNFLKEMISWKTNSYLNQGKFTKSKKYCW